MLRLVVAEGARRERVDRVLAGHFPEYSRSSITRWIGEGRVRVDGKPCRPKDRVAAGSVVEFEPGPPLPSRAEPDSSVVFAVVYDDEHLVVIDKPAGLVVHPARGHASGTLVNGLLALPGFGRPPADERDPEGPMRPGIVHRIDKDTSGLLVVAKHEVAREGLKRAFASHDIERAYFAITLGVPKPGSIDTLHGRHPKQRMKFTSFVEQGKRARTELSIVERYGELGALVRCELRTGRTHQIRVHLCERAGTPILSDALYGRASSDPALVSIAKHLGRQALHAAVLGFVHPVTAERVRFESPLPPDMAQAVRALRELE